MIDKLRKLYNKYKVYIRVDFIMYAVMFLIIGIAVVIINLMKE